MKDWNEREPHWRKFYECDCGAEGIMLSRPYAEEDNWLMDFAIFEHHQRWPLSFKQKLRYMWKVLTTGVPFSDYIVINKSMARRLGHDLTEWGCTENKINIEKKEG